MRMRSKVALFPCLILLAFPAFAKDKPAPKDAIQGAKAPAWSLRASQREMIVQVSPARQTLQILGSSAAVIGTSISAVVDEKYRRQVDEVLQGYDADKVFRERLEARLNEVIGAKLKSVGALTSTAGYSTPHDAAEARYASLGKAGTDLILDLKMTYGLFGYEGTLIAKLDGDLHETPSGHRVWNDTLVVSSEPILATDRLTDPTKMLSSNFSSPRLSVEEGAIAQWTGDGGKELRRRFEAAVDGVVSALLTDLGLVNEAIGDYYLGKVAMNRKDFDIAAAYFDKALALDPKYVDAQNGASVNWAHAKNVDKAIAIAEEIVAANPEFGPAHFNLAWWYATAKKDAAKAKPHYDKALSLGLPQEKKIDKALNGKK